MANYYQIRWAAWIMRQVPEQSFPLARPKPVLNLDQTPSRPLTDNPRS
jgi:hypothetical protein